MKIAAIKARMGIWQYYVTAMTFDDISKYVSPITKEISNSESYSNILQRSISSNVDSIKTYLLEQGERFFNSIVLAIYDGNPDWYELQVNVEEYETYSVGILEFTGDETIFPVDGQHRVEGIKKAIQENDNLKNEKVSVIFIGHRNDPAGKIRTRRLFSTLNRRAKRVKENEIIALDEDDIVAIVTRYIAEQHVLFAGNRLRDYPNKNVPSSENYAFTSILTLYEVNQLLFDEYAKEKGLKGQKKREYLLYRPSEEDVTEFTNRVVEFWNCFSSEIPQIKEYLEESEDQIKQEKKYRSEDGGLLLFRPIALSRFVQAILQYMERKASTLNEAVRQLARIPMSIQDKPWKNFLWLEERKNINNRVKKKELFLMMMFLADEQLLSEKETNTLVSYILSSRDLDDTHKNEILEELRALAVRE